MPRSLSTLHQLDLSRPGRCKVWVWVWLEASSSLPMEPWLDASNLILNRRTRLSKWAGSNFFVLKQSLGGLSRKEDRYSNLVGFGPGSPCGDAGRPLGGLWEASGRPARHCGTHVCVRPPRPKICRQRGLREASWGGPEKPSKKNDLGYLILRAT